MKKLLILLLVIPFLSFSQETESKFKKELKKTFKFSTFYGAINGGTSLSDKNTFSVNTGTLISDVIETPFDYSVALGIRKIELMYFTMVLKNHFQIILQYLKSKDLNFYLKVIIEESKVKLI